MWRQNYQWAGKKYKPIANAIRICWRKGMMHGLRQMRRCKPMLKQKTSSSLHSSPPKNQTHPDDLNFIQTNYQLCFLILKATCFTLYRYKYKMFAEFENMIKGKLNAIKQTTTTDITRVPQKYNIKGRTIQQLKLLSEGSFGFIWLAEDVNTKQKFALKRIVCITNDRFQLAKNELELMLKFPKSKNIVTCYGGELVTLRNGSVENKVWIILMQYCPHGTLFDLLQTRQNKGFSQKQLVQIVSSILQGLKGIHQVGCYHQDVKIQNVLIGEDRSFKLCDFGSCSNRFIDFKSINKSEYNHIKEEMEAVTTPMYRPPQMVDPYLQYQVSYKVDVWMVGCVLFTLAYFTHPFVDSNAIGIAGGVYRFPKYPQETKYQVSEKIKDLIRNLLTPNPQFRPSVQQALQIVNNWYTLTEIPLNKEARRRKEQQRIKEKQMQQLNKKVVDLDGDIPMEKLLQLQKKLKNSKETNQSVKSTFITSKQTKLIKQGVPTAFNQQSFFSPVQHQQPPKKEEPKPRQETVNANSFWNTPAQKNTTQSTNNGNSFNSFASFFPTSKIEPKPQTTSSNNDIYDYFFAPQTKPASQSIAPKVQKNVSQNLLDL